MLRLGNQEPQKRHESDMFLDIYVYAVEAAESALDAAEEALNVLWVGQPDSRLKKGRLWGGPSFIWFAGLAGTLEVHAAHTAHAAARHRRSRLLLGRLGNHGFRGDQKSCH